MPLHLLGKKSWNVYNADNIARVRRDEASAKAAEEAEEQRMQEIDAQRRLAILRGEAPPPLVEEQSNRPEKRRIDPERPKSRRKRKREGEDDTDFELRLAKERAELTSTSLEQSHKSSGSAPIVDRRGHFTLFGDEKRRAHAEKNEEVEREAQKNKRKFEDQYTMRLSQAAGKGGIKQPWYNQGDANRRDEPLKDVWGNDDPRRNQRDKDRMVANDPLAMMKKGASRVRELKQERTKIQVERDADLRQLRKDARRRESHRRKDDGGSKHYIASPDSSRRRSRSRGSLDGKHDRNRRRDSEERRHEQRRHADTSRSRDRDHRRRRENTRPIKNVNEGAQMI